MLRTALAALLALASVWEGPVTLPSDDHFNDTFHGFLNETNATVFRRDEIQPGGCVLIYLRGAPDRCLVFKPNRLMPFETYVDSSWESKFSCSGAMLFVRGCLFMWFVKTQRSVSLSSAEAEYFGAMLAAREVIFHRELFVDLMFALDGPTIIYTDSKSAIDLSLIHI